MKRRTQDDFSDELKAHLQIETDRLIAGGMSPGEARLAARRTFGNVTRTEERFYEQRRTLWLDGLRRDIRYALRTLARAPGFTVVAALTLALGVGATSAIFSVINAVLLRPLPYSDPDRLVMVWSRNTNEGRDRNTMSPADFVDLKSASQALDDAEALQAFLTPGRLTTESGAASVLASASTAGMYELLGRTALIGRVLRPHEERGAIILSYGYWTRAFGGSPSVLGKQVTFNNQPVTIVGVMPSDFAFPYPGMLGPTGFSRRTDVDVWTGLPFEGPNFGPANQPLTRGTRFLALVGRMKPGTSLANVQAEMDGLTGTLAQTYAATNKGWGATTVALHEQVVGSTRPALTLLWAGVSLVLLIACVNVGNLLLTRSVGRQREMALRVALGATRGSLARQTLTEMAVLGAASAAVSWVVVVSATRLFVALAPGDIPRLNEITFDVPAFLFSLLVAIGSALVIGLVPTFAVTRSEGHAALQDGARVTGGLWRRRVRTTLVTAEIALAALLTIGAGLLIRSFVTVLDVDPGFVSDSLLTMQMNVPDRFDTADKRRAFYREFFDEVGAIPGVVTAGGTTRLPLGSTNVTTQIAVEGQPLPPGQLPEVEFRRALGEYFTAMQIPVVRGRAFDDRDNPSAPGVVIVNQTFAARFFGGVDPIGRRVRLGAAPTLPWLTIVGVIGDVRHQNLEMAPAPELYITSLQNPPVNPFIVIRSVGDPAGLASQVRAAAQRVDPALVPYDIRTMAAVRSESVSPRRFIMTIATGFGLVALVLALIGVYSVMSLGVSERTAEFGIRLALGAEPRQVVQLVVGRGARIAAIGITIGVGVALALTPLMRRQLFGVGTMDPWTMVGVPILLLAASLLACLVPARRAMRVDPVAAIRTTG